MLRKNPLVNRNHAFPFYLAIHTFLKIFLGTVNRGDFGQIFIIFINIFIMMNWILCFILGCASTMLAQHIPYVVRHHESHIMSEKKYFSFWQIWILQIPSFKSIYNLPYFIVSKIHQKNYGKLESCMAQFSFPSVFHAFGAFMISDFIRVTW